MSPAITEPPTETPIPMPPDDCWVGRRRRAERPRKQACEVGEKVCINPDCKRPLKAEDAQDEYERRGLCHKCYRQPAIRARFPRKIRSEPDTDHGYELPEDPTEIPPGPERVPIYAARARMCLNIHHEKDYTPTRDEWDELKEKMAAAREEEEVGDE